ncbi:hypothetical protein FRB98_003746, partial [Tulasnella sp. 332]
MPSVSHITVIRTQPSYAPLSFTITHCLDVISSSATRLTIKPSTLSSFITHKGQVVIRLFATCHLAPIDHQFLLGSGWVRILIDLLRLNQALLGLDNISDPYIEDDLVKGLSFSDSLLTLDNNTHNVHQVSLTPSGPMDAFNVYLCPSLPHHHLTDVLLEINWGGKQEPRESDLPSVNPFFAESTFSEIRETWAKVIDRFFKHHMIKKYPYIFGTWKDDFAAEKPLYRSMAQSLCEMFLRSPNKDFTQQGKTIFESLREKRRAAVERAWYDLENLKTRSNAPAVPFKELKELRGQITLMIEDDLEEGDGASTEEEFVDVVCLMLTSLYAREVKPGKKDLHASEMTILLSTSTLGGLDDYPLHHFDEGEEDSQYGLPNDDAATHIAMLKDRPSQLMLSDHNCLSHETKESSQSPPLEFMISEEPFHSGSP